MFTVSLLPIIPLVVAPFLKLKASLFVPFLLLAHRIQLAHLKVCFMFVEANFHDLCELSWIKSELIFTQTQTQTQLVSRKS